MGSSSSGSNSAPLARVDGGSVRNKFTANLKLEGKKVKLILLKKY